MSDKNTSTLQSAVDSVTGAAQSVAGSVTGNTGQQQAGENKRDEAAAKDTLSHTTAKAGPFTATPQGVAKDDPNRTQGSWNQTVGSAKESIGNFTGAEGLKKEGIQQNQEGKGQEAQGQLSDLGSGVKDRITGTAGNVAGAVTGDREAQRKAEEKHDKGKTQQRGVEHDLQKQA
ncbi:MAG: hypothetical protein M1831_001848 [Alyxoria varia]|nr:MAG: hypothetical protein M1831_001848 [Alyxoria varia]